MLITRILTALVLLAVLLPVLYSNNFTAFAVVASLFFGAAIWESFRLFNPGSPTQRRRQPQPSFGLLEVEDGRLTRHEGVRF